MKIQNYHAPYNDIADVIDTQFVDGMYEVERRKSHDRRNSWMKFQGYDRRLASDRREFRTIDEYV